MTRLTTLKHLLSRLFQRLAESCPPKGERLRKIHASGLAVFATKPSNLVEKQPVEFFGGPFDGHVKEIDVAAAHEGETLAIIPVTHETIARLEWVANQYRSASTNSAVYELAYDGSRWGLHFVRRITASGSGQNVKRG